MSLLTRIRRLEKRIRKPDDNAALAKRVERFTDGELREVHDLFLIDLHITRPDLAYSRPHSGKCDCGPCHDADLIEKSPGGLTPEQHKRWGVLMKKWKASAIAGHKTDWSDVT